MKFKKYLSEASTSSATNMELAIVEIWNTNETKYLELEGVAKSICDFLRNNGVTGKATHMGSQSLSISNSWKKYGGTDKTPKTDLIIGDYKISLKKKGGSQLVSGSKNETASIFYTVAEQMKIFDQIKPEFDSYLEKFVFNKKIDREQTVTSLKKSNKDIDIINADKMHKDFTKILNDYFKSNKEFKNNIIIETMTGRNKFGENSIGCANYVLIFGNNYNEHKLKSVNDKAFINEISNNAKITMAFKSMSSGKVRNILSVFRLQVNEGIFDKIKLFWNKLKNSFYNLLVFMGFNINISGTIKF